MLGTKNKHTQLLGVALLALLASGCATGPPKNINDICAIFEEKPDWYESARESYGRWGVPIPVMMAIIHQESSFRADVRPPRTKILGFIPGPRPSTAYGYAQALETTWDMYIRGTGRRGAERDDFGDVIDFVGWYCDVSNKRCGISKKDAYNLYLAHHEGHGGFNDLTYRDKKWLLEAAEKVRTRAKVYSRQLSRCREKLDRPKEKKFWFF